MRETDRIVLSEMMHRISNSKDRENIIEDEVSMIADQKNGIHLLMRILDFHVYSTASIMAEIVNFSRFPIQRRNGRLMPVSCQDRNSPGTGT